MSAAEVEGSLAAAVPAAADFGGEGGLAAAAGDDGSLFGHFNARATELSDDKKYKEKSFIEYVNHPNIASIIANFSYPADGDTSTVEDTNGLINAFFANDLYKLSMGPVVNQVSKHQNGCIVQFKVDLRMADKDSFNVDLQRNYVLNQDSTFVVDLAAQLNSFKERTFNPTILANATIGGGPAWRAYWQDQAKAYPIQGRTLIESDQEKIKEHYKKRDGTDITDADFHQGTVILTCIPFPKNTQSQSPVVLSVVPGGAGKKPDIRATGYWPLCSWLETPLMQSTYQVLHRQSLKDNGKTYGAWIAESLYRTFSSMCFLADKTIKVALFSGRRTGGALFNLLQVYLWNQFDVPGTPPPTDPGRNLGTSSFWALETLNDMGMTCSIKSTGTHAHELSMTLNVLYPKLDVTDVGFVGSQILGHLLYKRLSAGPTPTPMLTDTVGTRNFLVTAVALKDGDKPALCSFSSARQDSGKLVDYANMMKHFVVESAKCEKLPGLMASEVDKNGDFMEANDHGYTLSGVGGLLGDSEKTEDVKILGKKFDKNEKLHFGASMAVKIARVWSGIGNDGYTLKTGDGDGKVTIDDKADDKVVADLEKRAKKFQDLHQDAVKALISKQSLAKLELPEADVAAKQKLLNRLLDDIAQGRQATKDDRPVGPSESERLAMLGSPVRQSVSDFNFGGRRTRRKARKHTKKNVRKNNRKSKYMRNRRSNRRNSRK